jgi:hypothetical protein
MLLWSRFGGGRRRGEAGQARRRGLSLFGGVLPVGRLKSERLATTRGGKIGNVLEENVLFRCKLSPGVSSPLAMLPACGDTI